MSDVDALMESEDVGEWGDYPTHGVVFMCGPGAVDETCPRCAAEDACDCGFDGEWDKRRVYVVEQGRRMLAGWDERCPSCGDIERFDNDANRVRCFSSADAQVLSLVPTAPEGGPADG